MRNPTTGGTPCLHCGSRCYPNTFAQHFATHPKCAERYGVSHGVQDGVQPARCMPGPIEDDIYAGELQEHVFKDLSELYWFRYLGETCMNMVRGAVSSWIDFALCQLKPEIERILDDPVLARNIQSLITKRLDFFNGLTTESQAKAYLTSTRPLVSFHEIPLGPRLNENMYVLNILEWLRVLLTHDDEVRMECVRVSELWKSGACLIPPAKISTWYHGSSFRKHDFAQPRVDKPGEPIELLIDLMVGRDGLGLLDPLGAMRGEKGIDAVYGALGNLPAKERFKHKNMGLLTVLEEDVEKKYTPTRALAGMPHSTRTHARTLARAHARTHTHHISTFITPQVLTQTRES